MDEDFGVISLFIVIAFWICVGYVIGHFIFKYW